MTPRRLCLAVTALLLPLLPTLGQAEGETPPPAKGMATPASPAVSVPVSTTQTDFVRFVEDDTGARLQTGIATYRNKEGVTVDLVGAIHIADATYFEELNEAFKGYDAVLYEMVGGPISQRERRAAAAEHARLSVPEAANHPKAGKPQTALPEVGDRIAEKPAAKPDPDQKYQPKGEGSTRATAGEAPNNPGAGKTKTALPEVGDRIAEKPAAKPKPKSDGTTLEDRIADIEAYMKENAGDSAVDSAYEEREAAAAGKLSWLHSLHATLQNSLALQGQLEGIDYHAPNLVHADMSLAQFADMQNQRKEGFVALWFKAVQAQMASPQTTANQPGLLKILEILCRKDSATELKRLFGRTFDSVEAIMAGMETGDGTVIVTERNKVALAVLEKEIKAGRMHLAVFYGA
ncbi:MAG TPA: hypothetical protein VK956_08245, partial [Verrucomicrobium sp.]|nr:hypothetical protein [Verrucomicrobium sp.]